MVTAARSVLMRVFGVLDAGVRLALVPVVVVLVVAVPVVHVVDMVPMGHGHVTAVGSVDVGVRVPGGPLRSLVRHGVILPRGVGR